MSQWPALAWFAVMVVQMAAAQPKLVVPRAADLVIRTRQFMERPGSAVMSTALFFQGARQRREMTFVHARETAPTSVSLTQCDERRTVELDPQHRTYLARPIED